MAAKKEPKPVVKQELPTIQCVNCTERLPVGTVVCANCGYRQP